METSIGIGRRTSETVLMVVALVLVVAALAAGYGIRALTEAGATRTTLTTSGGDTTPALSDAPCIWTGTAKGC